MNLSKLKKHICVFFVVIMLLGTAFSVFASADTNSSFEDLNGAKIGVLTGTMLDVIAKEYIENPDLQYFNDNSNVAIALEKGKIDAYLTDEPIARSIKSTYPDHIITHQITYDDYGFIFKKGDEKATELCNQFNEFLAESKNNGTYDVIDSKWFGTDESKKTIDFSSVEKSKGETIKLATSSGVGVPFSYSKDGEIVGFEIDLTVEFCKKYDYKLEITDFDFTGVMSAVQSGAADIGAACITISDERKESMLFSDATYEGGIVSVGRASSSDLTGEFTSIDQLKGKKIGVVTGTVYDKIAEEFIESPELCYYTNASDVYAALDAGKIDAYVVDSPVVSITQHTYPDQVILKQVTVDEYAYVFQKDNPEATELCNQLNEFLSESKKNGLLDELKEKWLSADKSIQVIDYESAEKNTGRTLTYAMTASGGAPFTYFQDGKPAGYDVDVAVEFCKAYGYKIKIDDYDFTGLMGAIQSGKADFAGCCIAITEERKESMLFSDPNYTGGVSIVVKNGDGASGESTTFITSVKESFIKTFIRESRWKLFLTGIKNTMLITVVSILFGTFLGFATYMICRRNNKIANTISRLLMAAISGMPVVVLLMILFYIIFGESDLNGIWVAIIGFSLTFGTSVFGMLKTGVGAIDNGQNEAAFALGFSNTRTFYRVILPQASTHFLPLFRSEVVAHIKATAIVGYIAVQDLTKVSDIVRSRTYEAFFPLIATAIIYFLLEGLLIVTVDHIQIFTDKRRRSSEKILKGINTK